MIGFFIGVYGLIVGDFAVIACGLVVCGIEAFFSDGGPPTGRRA